MVPGAVDAERCVAAAPGAADPAADHGAPAPARRAGVSVRHLARLFREQTGVTPAGYAERVRVEEARLLPGAGRV